MIKTDFKIKHATPKQVNGTSRIGTIHSSFEELKEKLGDPHDCTVSGDWESGDKKVRVEWAFVINNDKNLVFTIYDYKSRFPLEQIKQWSLGGRSSEIKEYLSKILLVE
ncbi:MAG: hypothetical protein K9M44_00120 [Candidatus Pacebacteria bacterium]|nr:hypothetical protein [Candidatus Paceibacterota bacterium]